MVKDKWTLNTYIFQEIPFLLTLFLFFRKLNKRLRNQHKRLRRF